MPLVEPRMGGIQEPAHAQHRKRSLMRCLPARMACLAEQTLPPQTRLFEAIEGNAPGQAGWHCPRPCAFSDPRPPACAFLRLGALRYWVHLCRIEKVDPRLSALAQLAFCQLGRRAFPK